MKYKFSIVFTVTLLLVSCRNNNKIGLTKEVLIEHPKHGFLSSNPASKWEESAISGNGTLGILIPGDINMDRIVFSHEKLFMPQYKPYKAPNLGSRLREIRKLMLQGKETEVAEIAVEEGIKSGISELEKDDFVWTNPHIPACQLELENLNPIKASNYGRSVNYETGEIIVAFGDGKSAINRKAFVSRKDGVSVIKISSLNDDKLSYRFNLNQLPNTSDEFNPEQFVKDVNVTAEGDYLSYGTNFIKSWEGSLKGYNTATKIIPTGGTLTTQNGAITIKDADEILIISSVALDYNRDKDALSLLKSKIEAIAPSYDEILKPHAKLHGEMYNRFSFSLGHDKALSTMTSEELLASSSVDKNNPALTEQIIKAARYNVICATGEIPPALQGIWGGTWRPNWSGDFTLNGNVPTVIASGLNTNLTELTDAYLNMMNSWKEDFRKNSKGLYGIDDGIYVPSRGSEFGSCYHYQTDYPHLYWYAGTAWAAHFFYDKWLYNGDEEYLKNQVIPFMLEGYNFLSKIVYKHDNKYMFIPSYSPEIGPLDKGEVAINATMDIAAMKQLLRNLITLVKQGFIPKTDLAEYEDILANLPAYTIDKKGELKEWIWEGYENDNEHRHASHLYPLYDGVDSDFKDNEALMAAAKQAIEARLEYRRTIEGGDMAFGLVQLAMAAAHAKDIDHAYECVRWLTNQYWTPAFVSYHDPGAIFNLDISGGFPAVISYMLLQSTISEIELLPVLPKEWPNGSVKGITARGGYVLDMEWENGQPSKVKITSLSGNKTTVKFADKTWDIDLDNGASQFLDLY